MTVARLLKRINEGRAELDLKPICQAHIYYYINRALTRGQHYDQTRYHSTIEIEEEAFERLFQYGMKIRVKKFI